MGQCRACHREAERARRACMADKRNRRRISAGLVRLREAQSDRQVRSLCGEIVSGLGGINRFMEAWQTMMRRDLERGGYAAFRHLDSILKLAQYCERNQPDYRLLTDDQLEAAVSAFGMQRPL